MTAQMIEAPEWATVPVEVPPTRRVVAVALGVALVGDLAVRAGFVGLAGALLFAAVSAALLASGRLRTPTARALVAAAPFFGGWLAVRTSPWLLPLDVIAALLLLGLGASLSSGGSVADLPFASIAARAWHGFLHVLSALGFFRPLAPAGRSAGRRVPALVRGACVALPVLALLGALLASADAVFASFFAVDVDAEVFFEHVFVVAMVGWLMLGLVRVASARAPQPLPTVGWQLGRVETTVVLGSVIVLFAAFAVAQVIALAGGADHVLETAGLTYAEYARTGFFQLLWVAGVTVAGLLVVRATTAAPDRRFAVLSEIVVALTLVIVVVAVHRLGLYKDAYGLTMLRLYSSVFAVWIGAVLVLVGLAFAGVGRGQAWWPSAAVAIALAILFVLNVMNPEAVVVRHNLNRGCRGAGGHPLPPLVVRRRAAHAGVAPADAQPGRAGRRARGGRLPGRRRVRRMGGVEPRPAARRRGAGAPLRGIGQTPRRL